MYLVRPEGLISAVKEKAIQDIQQDIFTAFQQIKLVKQSGMIKYFNINRDKCPPGKRILVLNHFEQRGRWTKTSSQRYFPSGLPTKSINSSFFNRWSRAEHIVKNLRRVYSLPRRRLSRDEQALAGHIPRTHQPLSDDYNQRSHTV